jgi:hypothetical protein
MSRHCLLVGPLLLACSCALAGGCSKGSFAQTADVSGKIKIRGQAPRLKGMEIVFLGANGTTTVSAPVNEDGTYTASGVPVGEVRVGLAYTPDAKGRRGPVMPGKNGEAPPPVEPLKNPIPEPLRDPSTSNLTFKVESDKSNVFDYDVQ